jgi:hypothetical protein
VHADLRCRGKPRRQQDAALHEPAFGVRKLDRTLWCGSLLPRPWNVQIPDGEFCALQENPEKPASVKARETTRGVSAVMSAAAAQPAPGGRRNRLGFMRLIGPGWVTKPAVRVIIPDIFILGSLPPSS